MKRLITLLFIFVYCASMAQQKVTFDTIVFYRGGKLWKLITWSDSIQINAIKYKTFPGFGTTHAKAAYGDHTHAYVSGVTVHAPLVTSGGLTPQLSIPAASGSVAGYLSSEDWTTFNGKVSSQWTTSGSNVTYSAGDAVINGATVGSGNGKNTILGKSAIPSGTGYSNIAVGEKSLYSATSGNRNVALGDSALYRITSGSGNIAIGLEAGRMNVASTGNQTSQNSIFIGKQTRAGTAGDTNEIVIGHQTNGKGSNTTIIGNTNTGRTYLMGALTIDSIPTNTSPDSVATVHNGKIQRMAISSLTSDTTLYANVVKWGADKNGWVSSTAAFQAAINSGKPVLVPDGNYLIDSLTLLDNTTIVGMGIGHSQLILPSGSGYRVLFKINGKNYVRISDLSLLGGSYSYTYSSAIGSRIGIEIINSGYVTIERCKIFGFDAYGVKSIGTDINLTFYHVIDKLECSYNYCGYDIGTNAEYGTFHSLHTGNCKYGLRLSGGNNKFDDLSCESSAYGLYMYYCPNNGHGSIVGSSFNHCTKWGIWIDSVQTKGMTFTGCQIHNGGLLVNKSQNIRFAGGSNIMADSIEFVGNCAGSGFSGCTINVGANPLTRDPGTDYTVCKDNLYSDLSTPNLNIINDGWYQVGTSNVYNGDNLDVNASLSVENGATISGTLVTDILKLNNFDNKEEVSFGSNELGGANEKIYSSLGDSVSLELSNPNLTLGTGWKYYTGYGVEKYTNGTGTITRATSSPISAGIKYRVSITVSSISGGMAAVSLGGNTFLTINGTSTYSRDVIAVNTDDIIITPTSTNLRMVILSIEIHQLDKGNLKIEGALSTNQIKNFFDQPAAVINDDSYWGFGMVNPVERIDVNGNVKITGYQKIVKVSATPTLSAGETAVYTKGNYYVIAYMDGSTTKYRYFNLTATANPPVWVYSTTSP